MAIRPLPDPKLLRKLIDYDPRTGKMVWLTRPEEMFASNGADAPWRCRIWNSKNAGNRAFCNPHGSGHLSGTIFGELFLAHRVAWAIHYGQSEFGLIDHINGNGRDNRIANLRVANREANAQNCRRRNDCSSGVTGVHWYVNKRWGNPCWVARIQVGKRRIFLGSFETKEEAIAARREAELKYNFGPVHGVVRND